MGSCFEGPSTKRGLDLAESSPNGPKWTREQLKAVSPKNAENGETGTGSPPQNPMEGRCGSALTFAQVKTLRNSRRRGGRSPVHRRLLDTGGKKKVQRPPRGSSSRSNTTES